MLRKKLDSYQCKHRKKFALDGNITNAMIVIILFLREICDLPWQKEALNEINIFYCI